MWRSWSRCKGLSSLKCYFYLRSCWLFFFFVSSKVNYVGYFSFAFFFFLEDW